MVIVSIAAGALALWAFWIEPASLRIDQHELRLAWPAERSLRIAVLSDLHVGSPFNGIRHLRAAIDRTNATAPDLVCILGDLVIQGVVGGTFVSPEAIATELGRLHSRSGVFAVLGNHDGWLDHDRVHRAVASQGIRIIEDTAVQIETPSGRVWLAGISDLWTGRHDIVAALEAVTDDRTPVLLLTHNPDVFPEVPDRVTLTLAGHTHGGQVNWPFVGAPIVPSKYRQRFAAGHVVEGGRHLFVATGIGTSILPVRFRVPPAVSLLTLTAAHP